MVKTLQIYRNDQLHLVVNIDEDTFFSQVVMGEHIISSSFISDDALDIDEGDYIMLDGERFSINKKLPPLTRSASDELRYNLQLQGYIYDLHYCAYRHLGSAEFELFATADVYIGIMVGCLNNIYTGWTVGTIDVSEPKLIQFFESGKGFSCKGAIIKIAETFGLEFWLTGKTINLTAQAGVDTNITFEYGRGRGLYEIVRGEIDNELYFNRLYVEGSTRNIPVGYRGGMKRLQIDVPYLQLDIPAGKRIRETSVVIEDIFPKRVGTITTVSADWLTITDASIDFDLNGSRIEGEKATVEMLTGENSGQSFEIDKYNPTTKTIILVPNTETTGEVRPNATFEIKPGDQYFFAGIKVPESYITAAEAQLKTEGLKLLQKAAAYVPPYSVKVSDKFMRDNGLKINAGDRVRLKDAALGIDVKIRVSAVKFSLVDPYTVDLLISDVIPYTSEDKAIIDIDKTKKDVVVVDRVNKERARQNWKATSELATLLDTVRAEMLLIVSDGGEYSSDIIATTGFNSFTTTAGTLYHEKYEEFGGIWGISAYTGSLPDNVPYYVYIRVSRTVSTGQVILSTTKIPVESDPAYYYLPFGIISSVFEGTRLFTSTKGYTRITGENIKTGTLEAGILKTGSTGGRIEAIGNTLRFFNASDNVQRQITIDANGNTTDIWYNTNGTIARRQAVESGVVKDVWNDVNGNFVLELGQNGIVTIDNTPETWNPVTFLAVATFDGSRTWEWTCININNTQPFTCESSTKTGRFVMTNNRSTPIGDAFYFTSQTEFSRIVNGYRTGDYNCSTGYTGGGSVDPI